MLTYLKNQLLNSNRYWSHPEAVIVACFFNPQRSEYRTKAFNIWYESIKHLNHHIIEGVIGGTEPQLPFNKNIGRLYTKNLLWHKESLLNKAIANLPEQYKYIFWVDADVIFTNKRWLFDATEQMKNNSLNIIQPFSYAIHMEQDELEPSFNVEEYREIAKEKHTGKRIWVSFCSNYVKEHGKVEPEYINHGHVGFAWGARRELLEEVPLYERALVGGADHIIAHACAGQIPHPCITKHFYDDIDEVNKWSRKFFFAAQAKIGYVEGDLYHIWHGDVDKRNYSKRITDFTKQSRKIVDKDAAGMYVTEDDSYVRNYFNNRELTDTPFEVEAAPHTVEMGGGHFGGGGASASWDEAKEPAADHNDTNVALINDQDSKTDIFY